MVHERVLRRRSDRGFTIIELIIVVFVLGVLLTVAIVQLNNAQNASRDEERKSDINSIARRLETIYDANGYYPSTADFISAVSADNTFDANNLRAPGVATTAAVSIAYATTNAAQTPANNLTYVYQPLDSNNAICTTAGQQCATFNLYYTTEVAGTTTKVTSKRQF